LCGYQQAGKRLRPHKRLEEKSLQLPKWLKSVILLPSNQKGNKMTEFESKCYGMSEADIREQYMESITARHCGLEMVVMGILSDAQEMVAVGYSENVRLYLNRAKFILCEIQDQRQAAALLADELTTE
jgi:hypothetical protein